MTLVRGLVAAKGSRPMNSPNDDLLTRAVQGDQNALVALFRRYGMQARQGLAGRIPRCWQSVLSDDDVMQQTYADAAVAICRFDSRNEGSFAKWLALVARRNLRDAIKMLEAEKRGGNRRRVEAKGDQSFVALWELLAARSSTPSRHVAGAEARAALKQAIEQLPEDYARVVVMYDLEGRAVNDVAESLNRSPGAVFMLRARAHQRLHEIMGRTSKYFANGS